MICSFSLSTVQEEDDRKKIRHLLSMTEPIEQEVTYFKECNPETTLSLKKFSQSKKIKKESAVYKMDEDIPSYQQPTQKSLLNKNEKDTKNTQPQRILRTVFVPNEKTDALLLQNEALKTQLEEQKKFFEEKIETIYSEKKLAEEELATAENSFSQTVKRLNEELEQKVKVLQETTKKYVFESYENKKTNRELTEENINLKKKNEELAFQMEHLKQKFMKEAKMIVINCREQSEEYAKKFRQEAMKKENEILALKDETSTLREENLALKKKDRK